MDRPFRELVATEENAKNEPPPLSLRDVMTATPSPSAEPWTAHPPTAQPLRDRVRAEGENRPGVYRFTGPRGEVLYVGKSIRLRSRLLSYFRPDAPRKVRELLRVAAGIEWEHAPNEFEALLREFRQIRAFRPRFNKQHKTDRRFAWIRITREAAPRLAATRRPLASKGRHFGPFPARRRLPALLRELSGMVGLRDCPSTTHMRFADQSDLFDLRLDPACPRADLGSCPAPCAGRCTVSEYAAAVSVIERFLDGLDDAPLEALSRRMAQAAERQEFEQAALLRDRHDRLQSLRDRVLEFQEILRRTTFVYRLPSEPSGPDRGYVVVSGRVLFSFGFEPDAPPDLERRLRSRLDANDLTAGEVDDETREEMFLVTRWFRARPEELARTTPLESVLGKSGGHVCTESRPYLPEGPPPR